MGTEQRFVVDLQVTGKCNLACDFCDGAPKEHVGSRLPDVLAGIDKLVAAGLTTLNISGGEPLVRKDTPQIIAYARSKGIEVYLSTNALLLERFADGIFPYITTLGLPLDGSTTEMNVVMTRGLKQLETTLHFLSRFRASPPPFTVKVGTVVSAVNIHDIPQIGSILYEDETIYAPDVWRLYQFTPLGAGRLSKSRHSVSTSSFDRVVERVKVTFPTRIIVPLSNEASNDSYIFIDPRLLIYVFTDDDYLLVGDLRQTSIEELVDLKGKYSSIVVKGGTNRGWLSVRDNDNVKL